MTRTLEEIAARKRDGIDCDEFESAVVMRHFDQYATVRDAERDHIAGLFPLEFAQWDEEREAGQR